MIFKGDNGEQASILLDSYLNILFDTIYTVLQVFNNLYTLYIASTLDCAMALGNIDLSYYPLLVSDNSLWYM